MNIVLPYNYLLENREMGSSQSYPGLTEDVLEDYLSLTYLTKGEILHLMKKFNSISPEKLDADPSHRFSKEEIVKKFDVLRNNPFQDRLFRVFSSQNDNCFSFEDMLDLYSAMSSECPVDTKAAWAFKVYDLDDDKQISEKDICEIIDRLTAGSNCQSCNLERDSKIKIANILLSELRLDYTGCIGLCEFKIMMARIPEFANSFYFRL